jgi:hypothetical protein
MRNSRSAAVFPLSGEFSPLFSIPLCWSSERLRQLTSFLLLPRTQHTALPPQSLARDHRRRSLPRSSATSPWTAPSHPPLAKLSLPLGSPAPARANPPPRGPRTGPPAASHRRAHRRSAFLPRSAGSPAPSDHSAVSPPPSALADGWARGDVVAPARPRRLPRPWAAAGPQARPRARARAWMGRNPPPAQLAGFPFFFFFSHFLSPFSYIYLYANILCTKNSPNKS